MQSHLTAVSAIHIGLGAAGLLLATVVSIAVIGGGLISQDPTAIGVTSIVAVAVGAGFALLAIPSLVGGLGLLYRKKWSRVFLLVLGFLDLFSVPIGTAVGVYTIWVLMKDEAAESLG